MNAEDFNLLKGILKERSGLALSEDKHYLLESRLMPVARKLGMAGLDDLIRAIRTDRKETLLRDVTEAMTTNESYFFRDNQPFDQFRDLILAWGMPGAVAQDGVCSAVLPLDEIGPAIARLVSGGQA